MLLKCNSTKRFNVSVYVTASWEREVVEIEVVTHDFKEHCRKVKMFGANEFAAAIAYYNEQEHMLLEKYGGSEI